MDDRRAKIRRGLSAVVASEDSLLSPDLVDAYATDWLTPLAVAVPSSAEEASSIIGWANAERVGVVPWGAGTKQEAGLPQLAEAVVVSTARLARTVEVDAGNLTATVEAGTNVASFQEELAGHGRVLPLDPADAAVSTIGGAVSAGSSGPKRLSYGTARDSVLGLRAVLPTGEVVHAGGKTVKNVAGYDMRKLFIGSWGTLGLIVELTFRLLPAPESRQTILGRFASLGQAGAAVSSILTSQAPPSSVELIDGAAGQLVGGAVGLGEGDSLLMMEVEGLRPVVERQCETLAGHMRSKGALETAILRPEENDGIWEAYRRIPRHLGEAPERVVWLKLSVPLTAVADTLAAAKRLALDCGLGLGFVCHAGNGIAHVSAGGDEDAKLVLFVEGLNQAAARFGGFALVESAPRRFYGVLRIRPPRDDYFLMKALKDKLDPKGIMNPGRVITE